MSKIMGLDIGDRYIGIAVSDSLGLTAQGYRTYRRATREDDLKFFTDVVTQFGVTKIISGLPMDMEGNETAQARKTRNYCQFLAKRLKCEAIYMDERLTRENRKKHIDTLSAQLILQMYLDGNHSE